MGDFLSPADLARELGTTEQTIRRACRSGALPAARMPNGAWLIQRATLDALRRGEELWTDPSP